MTRRLHEIFSTWAASYGANSSAMTARGLESKGDEPYLVQVEAFRLVIAIDQALTYLESRGIDAGVYRVELKNWIDMVLHLPNNWAGQSKPNVGSPPTPMAHLQTLAILLDVDRPSLSPNPEQTLRTVLGTVFALLVDDDALSDSLRAYIYRLADEMRTALDDESICR